MPGLKDEEIRKQVYEAMQEDKPPYRVYKKTILARVLVRYLDPVRLIPAEVVLTGDPETGEIEDQIIKVWSVAEDVYLRRNNKKHLEDGVLIEFSGDDEGIETVNQISDDEIELILAQPYFALKNKLAEFTSPVPVRRFLIAAERMNRPIKTVEYIQSVLSKMEQDPEEQQPTDERDAVNVVELEI